MPLLMFVALAAMQSTAPAAAPAGTSTDPKAVLSKCGERRFEMVAEGMIDGKMKRRKVTLCAEPADTDQQWIGRLEAAIAWVDGQIGLSNEVKAKLRTDLRSEITRLTTGQALAASPVVAPVDAPTGGSQGALAQAGTAPAWQLPSVPTTIAPPGASLPAPRATSPSGSSWEVAALPPMPLPVAAKPVSLMPAGTSMRPVNLPRIDLSCAESGEQGDAECRKLSGSTGVLVRASADIPAGITLRFLRKGTDIGAEAQLGALQSGKSVRIRVPKRLCSGVVRSEATIQVLTRGPAAEAGQLASSTGPLLLHC